MRVSSGVLLLSFLPSCTMISRNRLEDFDRGFTVQQVADKTYVATDRDHYNSNILVAQMPDGIVLIASSPFETADTESLLNWVKFELDPKHIVAINTHHHLDGTGGNIAYKAHDVEIWASDLTVQLQADMNRADQRQGLAADHTFPYKEGKVFEVGGERIEVIYPGPGHSRDNMVVFLPQRSVLFGGCLVRPEDSLGNIKDADIAHWADSVASLKMLKPRVVIAGHDRVGGPELLESTERTARKAALTSPGTGLSL